MAKFFLVLAAFFVASAHAVELENLCSSDFFLYKGVLVNAFHRINQSVTFQPKEFYLATKVRCDAEQFKNRTNYLEVLRIRDEQ